MFEKVENKINLEVGDKIYYHGDVANKSGVGEVVKIKDNDYNTHIIEFEDGREMEVEAFNFSSEYKGNGRTRFVDYVEYLKYQREKVFEYRNIEDIEDLLELIESWRNFESLKIKYYKDGWNRVELETPEEDTENYFLVLDDHELYKVKEKFL